MPRSPTLTRLKGRLYPFIEQNDVSDAVLTGPADVLGVLDAALEVYLLDGRYLEPGTVTIIGGTNTVTQVPDDGDDPVDWTTRFQVGDEIAIGGSLSNQSAKYVLATVSAESLTTAGTPFATTETGLLYAKPTFGLWRRCQELGLYPGGYETDTDLREQVLGRWIDIQTKRGSRGGLKDELNRIANSSINLLESVVTPTTLETGAAYTNATKTLDNTSGWATNLPVGTAITLTGSSKGSNGRYSIVGQNSTGLPIIGHRATRARKYASITPGSAVDVQMREDRELNQLWIRLVNTTGTQQTVGLTVNVAWGNWTSGLVTQGTGSVQPLSNQALVTLTAVANGVAEIMLKMADPETFTTSGSLLIWNAGDPIPFGTTVVGGAARTYFDQSGLLHTATTNVARSNAYVQTFDGTRVPAWVIEGASTNACTFSYDLTNAAWAPAGGCTPVLDSSGLDGTSNTATTVTDASATQFGDMTRVFTIANDTAFHTFAAWIKKDSVTTRFPQIKLILSGGTVQEHGVSLNTFTGESASANTIAAVSSHRVLDEGVWWRVEIVVQNNATGNTSAQVSVFPAARTVMTGPDDATATGSIVVGNTQFEMNQKFSTHPILTTSTTVTRAAEAVSWSTPYTPATSTIYTKFIEQGTSLTPPPPRVLQIGNSGNASPRFVLYHNTTGYSVLHQVDPVGSNVGAVLTLAPAIGDLVELRALLNADGSVQLGQTINNSAEVTTATSGPLALAGAWSDQTLWLNSVGSAAQGFIAFQSIKIVPGVQTIDYLRAL